MFTVIIVDDEPIIKKSLTKLIEMKFPHFKVVGYAQDGKEALTLTRNLRPNLIITDIRMPEMDGIELIQTVETMGFDSKIVVVSGFDEFEYAQHALRHGAIDYLLKPIKPELFYKMLEKVENQLKSQKSLTEESSEWLLKCKEYSEEFITYLWGARKSECEELLLACYQEMTAKKVNSMLVKELFLNLYHFVKRGISSRLGRELICEELEAGPVNHEIEDIIKHINRWFTTITNHVQESKNWGSSVKINLAVEFIKDRFTDPNLTLQHVAESVNMSPAYFSRQFKDEYGKSFIQYLTELRMEQTKKLLMDIRLKTYEIAELAGYNDYPHFTKTFKKYYKMSPSEYRSLLKNDKVPYI
ncbi:hypothetical protein A8F94_14115 [Bacillus sp. FJAT-27225]|uniref:response regulator transcription factor n=1 Tax=Bacillus sp. FJAT-27225 TaxID=1743144 RepID=UPI00080C2D1A|nr:response regulator [Bacillus sp. FJAT-27225]OCA85977.1 hypothetical protein A8F94_14115 [Bacillus sp. FJAT-27225]